MEKKLGVKSVKGQTEYSYDDQKRVYKNYKFHDSRGKDNCARASFNISHIVIVKVHFSREKNFIKCKYESFCQEGNVGSLLLK